MAADDSQFARSLSAELCVKTCSALGCMNVRGAGLHVKPCFVVVVLSMDDQFAALHENPDM